MKRLYCCEVVQVLYVCAEDETKAEDLARRHFRDEVYPDVDVEECVAGHALWAGWDNAIPFGADDDTTVDHRLAEMNRRAELDALQVKMPWARDAAGGDA